MKGVRLPAQPRHVGQRTQARRPAPGQHLQPLAHEGAVQPDQRRHVGHRRQRHHVEQGRGVGAGRPLRPQRAVGGDDQQEHHPRRAQMAQPRVLILPVGVHHRQRVGQRLGALVMVQDHHVGARRARGGDRLETQRAAVHAHDQVMRRRQRLHRGNVRAVTLVDPVGDIDRRAQPEAAQPARQHRRGRGAVHVIVAEHRDALALRHRARHAGCGGVHGAQARRVGHQVAQSGRQIGRRLLRRDPPARQHARHDLGQAGALGDGQAHPLDRRGRADPAPPGQGMRHAKICG